jgi:hypothetical protein
VSVTGYPKPADQLTIEGMRTHAVWEFDLGGESDEDRDETWVVPVLDLPVDTLDNRFVTTQAILSNGDKVWVAIGNLDVKSPRKTAIFVTLSVVTETAKFHLARYYDPWYEEEGPSALAVFLGLSMNEVFPVRYDLTPFVSGDPAVVRGEIPAVTAETPGDDERMKLIFS